MTFEVIGGCEAAKVITEDLAVRIHTALVAARLAKEQGDAKLASALYARAFALNRMRRGATR